MTVMLGNGFPAEQKALVEQAGNILKTVAAGTGTGHDIARVAVITRLPGGQLLDYVAMRMLERIAATPNTSLVVLADGGRKNDPGVAGSATLLAEYGVFSELETPLYRARGQLEYAAVLSDAGAESAAGTEVRQQAEAVFERLAARPSREPAQRLDRWVPA